MTIRLNTTRPLGIADPGVPQQDLRDTKVEFEQAKSLMHLAWRQGKNHFPCSTGPDRSLRGGRIEYSETFTAMVVADLLIGQREHSMLVRDVLSMLQRELANDEVFHFFKEHERLPPDADCTALGLSVMLRGGVRVREQANRALDRILDNVDADGVVETYFDPTGERDGIVDAVVCANVLFLAHQLDRGEELEATLAHVRRVLMDGSYAEGTRYYHSPDAFLYFVGRVVHHFPQTHEALREPLRQAVRARSGTSAFTIDVAQRVLLTTWLDLDDAGELARLVEMQEADGCWPTDSLFRYGRKKIFFGSRVVATAFAIAGVVHGLERVRATPPAEQGRPTPQPAAAEPPVAIGGRSNVLAFPRR